MGVKTGLKGEAVTGNNLFVGRQWKVINEKERLGDVNGESERELSRERSYWENDALTAGCMSALMLPQKPISLQLAAHIYHR